MDKRLVLKSFTRSYGNKYDIYSHSLKQWKNSIFFLIKDVQNKYLVVVGDRNVIQKFEKKYLKKLKVDENNLLLKIACINHHNLALLREIFPWLSPSVSGGKASFGTADRLGIVTPAHTEAFENKHIFPILAQQSVRELKRTERDWREVLDDTIWGCFEAGYEGPFGADADHVKEIDDIQKGIDFGYTLFTIDPSDHVMRDISVLDQKKIYELYNKIPERRILEKIYLGKEYTFSGITQKFTEESLALAAVFYGRALSHVIRCSQYLKEHARNEFDLEVSVDETSFPTSPLSHIFITEELHRKGIDFQNLALHYIGTFQKAIDYIGNLDSFTREMKIQAEIAKRLGGYKLSLHSGGLKYSVYTAFAEQTEGLFHIKISTSWLESMRIVMRKNPDLYRQIHPYILEKFNRDKASYELTTDLSLIPDIDRISDSDLESLLYQDETRQVIHTTYGSILSGKNEGGAYLFRDKVYQTLYDNEKEHYKAVYEHVKKHLDLLQY